MARQSVSRVRHASGGSNCLTPRAHVELTANIGAIFFVVMPRPYAAIRVKRWVARAVYLPSGTLLSMASMRSRRA